ncbi:MAG: hypothetical protein KF830_11180 [Planctomycetes bacterium]|nr:hypothetical protein [Planctomycetota bacterium]
MPSKRWSLPILLLVAAHLVWGLLRAPTRALVRRAEQVGTFQRLGDAHYLFAQSRLEGADAIAWLRANTLPEQRVPWQGSDRGAIEFAAALLWPRLLVATPPGAAEAGLVATRTSLRLQRP